MGKEPDGHRVMGALRVVEDQNVAVQAQGACRERGGGLNRDGTGDKGLGTGSREQGTWDRGKKWGTGGREEGMGTRDGGKEGKKGREEGMGNSRWTGGGKEEGMGRGDMGKGPHRPHQNPGMDDVEQRTPECVPVPSLGVSHLAWGGAEFYGVLWQLGGWQRPYGDTAWMNGGGGLEGRSWVLIRMC